MTNVLSNTFTVYIAVNFIGLLLRVTFNTIVTVNEYLPFKKYLRYLFTCIMSSNSHKNIVIQNKIRLKWRYGTQR